MGFVENLTVAIIFFTTAFSQRASKIKLKTNQGLRLDQLESINIIGKPTAFKVLQKSVRYFKVDRFVIAKSLS